MTPSDVIELVAAVRELEGDNEIAHRHEDVLHEDVLFAISKNQCDDPAGCAAEALKTQDIKFQRWYA